MSGPVTPGPGAPIDAEDRPVACEPQIIEPRRADVGGFDVGRVLPRRGRRMVGAWCFMDRMGPGTVSEARPMNVGPHPHIGLQTVTWLVEGALLHRDSLGSEQLIPPGQLNLMTAGHGVSHSEETGGIHDGPVHGVQLWVAQPSATRDAAPAFDHHADLPQVCIGSADATVLVGSFAGAASDARCDTEHVAVEVASRVGTTVAPLDPTYEHAVLALGPGASVAGTPVGAGELAYLGIGRDELGLDASEEVRLLLIGGKPFGEELVMWWNYVARSRDEITRAHAQWTERAQRFGHVASAVPAVDADAPPWSR